jgi:hypothetical protein
MLPNLPFSLNIFFILTTLLCLFLVFQILKSSIATKSRAFQIYAILIFWLGIQAYLTFIGTYANNPNTFPPKIVLMGILPLTLFIFTLFVLPRTRKIIDTLSISNLTYMHLVRIPVEIALYWLFLQKAIPEIMTFEGRNFDILAGITAPIMVYFYKKGMNPKILIIWNIVALILLANIVFTAIFSTETPLQKFGFEQPNIAIIHFPFSWLATFIVPAVLFSHLASLRILLKKA